MAACKAFQPWHLERIVPQDEQVPEVDLLRSITAQQWTQIIQEGLAYTAADGDRIIYCCGLIPIWHGRAQGWTVFSRSISRQDMMFIHRMSLGLLTRWQSEERFRRIETTVRAGFEPGHRWAEMLCFHPEALMPRYDPHGRDYWLYSRI